MRSTRQGATRRSVVGSGLALGLAGLAGASALAGTPVSGAMASGAPGVIRKRRPNILFVMTDQERAPHLLPAGLDLPSHDWMRARGVEFTRYNVNTSPCSPSRSTIYFGRHTQDTGMVVNHGAPPFPELAPKLRSIGHHLRALGYYAAYKGKWHLSDVPHAAQLGYGPYAKTDGALEPFGFSDYNDDGDPHGKAWDGYRFDGPTIGAAIHWLDRTARRLPAEQPWFLAVNLVNPHDICFFESWEDQVKSRGNPDVLSPLKGAPPSPVYDKDWSAIPLPASFHAEPDPREPWAVRSYRHIVDLTYGALPEDEAVWRRNQGYYFNCVRDASDKVRRLLDALAAMGLVDDTIIVLTADHGEMAGAQRLRQKGPVIFRENVSVPFFISHPDARAPRAADNLASAVDILPTLFAMAGGRAIDLVDPLGPLPGVDLSPAVLNPRGRSARDDRGHLYDYGVPFYIDPQLLETMMRDRRTPTNLNILLETLKLGRLGPALGNRGLHRGVFDGRYKFARFFAMGAHHTPRDWASLTAHNDLALYDTEADPDELRNLALEPEAHRELILSLNEKTNRLVEAEVGVDNGREFPGPHWLYDL